jgi:hypothetical protein
MNYFIEDGSPAPYFTEGKWIIPIVVSSSIAPNQLTNPPAVNYETIKLEVESYEVTQNDLEALAVPYNIDSSVLSAEILRNLYHIQMQKDTAVTGETPRQYSLRKAIEHRVSAIESDEISDDAVSNALLTLLGSLNSRVTALENLNQVNN